MSEPIDPNDQRLLDVFDAERDAVLAYHRERFAADPDVMVHAEFHARAGGVFAVAHAVCPETHVVVRRDDLRKAVADMEYAYDLYDSGDCGNFQPNDRTALDHLTAALEDTP